MEADMAHPTGHEIAPEIDLLARIDRFLPIERQAVGVFGNGNARQEPLGGEAALDQACAGAGAWTTLSRHAVQA